MHDGEKLAENERIGILPYRLAAKEDDAPKKVKPKKKKAAKKLKK